MNEYLIKIKYWSKNAIFSFPGEAADVYIAKNAKEAVKLMKEEMKQGEHFISYNLIDAKKL